MSPEDFRVARSLADRLMASGEPSTLWDELADLSREQCTALDSIAFECATCNLWFPAAQNATPEGAQWYCKECV
jgi:hypothetical protein